MHTFFKSDIAKFLLRFFLLYGLLYTANYIYTGLTVPGGNYSPWLDEHLDYISALRDFTLNGASRLLTLFGYENYVYDVYLRVIGVKTVRMIYSCIGLNIIALWWAFVLSFPQSLKSKIAYFFGGTIVFIALNIIRIALVAVTPKNPELLGFAIDHHDVFNIVIYAIIILVIFRIINKNTKAQPEA